MKRLVIAFAIALTPALTHAQEQTTDAHAARVANQVSYEIMSPFCPGKTLAMCPSPAAAEVRMQIQEMAESGMTEEQIRDAVIEEHGEEFRTVAPPLTDNLGLLAGLAVAFLIAIFIVRYISRSRREENRPDASATTDDIDDDLLDDPHLAALREQYRS